MGGEGNRRSYCSSSGEEDGDANWKAVIESIASVSSFNSSCLPNSSCTHRPPDKDVRVIEHKPERLKHYQIKAQKLLHDLIENTLEVVRNPINPMDDDPMVDDCGIRLFKNAPPGIVFESRHEPERPRKKPRILPGDEEVNEKSKEFKRRLQSIAVDGLQVMAAAREARQRSLAKVEAKDAAAKAAAEREEKRIAELKRVRGERWLPSIAREMQVSRMR